MAFFMQVLDATILNTALPVITHTLERLPLAMQSVVSSYTLTVAMLIPVSGWLADRFGARRIFIFAVSLFTFNLHLLSVHCYTRSELLLVLNFVTMPGLAGPILGPLLGGWLVTYTTWHWLALDFPDQHSDWLAWHFRTQKYMFYVRKNICQTSPHPNTVLTLLALCCLA